MGKKHTHVISLQDLYQNTKEKLRDIQSTEKNIAVAESYIHPCDLNSSGFLALQSRRGYKKVYNRR